MKSLLILITILLTTACSERLVVNPNCDTNLIYPATGYVKYYSKKEIIDSIKIGVDDEGNLLYYSDKFDILTKRSRDDLIMQHLNKQDICMTKPTIKHPVGR